MALRPRSAFPPPLHSGSLGILASAVVRVPAWAGVAVQRGSGLSDPRCAPPAANPVGSPWSPLDPSAVNELRRRLLSVSNGGRGGDLV